jgi:hypothetical protein
MRRILFLATLVFLACGCDELMNEKKTDTTLRTAVAEREPFRYEPVRVNDYTYFLVDKKTGQVWTCSVHEAECNGVKFPRYKTKGIDHFESTPDDDSNLIRWEQ